MWGVYHCMSRVVAGEFLLDERSKEILCKQLFQVADFCGVEILTYCLMSNHFHVLVRVPVAEDLSDEELLKRAGKLYWKEDRYLAHVKKIFIRGDVDSVERLREKLCARMYDVSMFMKELKQRFSIWYNKSYDRYGVFWADRFKSVLVEGNRNSVGMVAAYIDLNPVRARIVEDPKDYRYSGYGEAMAGVSRSRKGLMKAMYEGSDWRDALEGYRELLFGKGIIVQKKGQSAINEQLAQRVLNERGRLSRSELLRCRVRYFSEGLIIGGKHFIEECYCYNCERKRIPQKMKGGDWGEMMVYRSFRNLKSVR